ncbi:hypothetical protein C1646_669703 [Rhizophagus diaphanus]|nr:hypothetical protein C1646_669703 [Rhizophagus diaphanus] [Rhizophagus sp. MUCL 43196]
MTREERFINGKSIASYLRKYYRRRIPILYAVLFAIKLGSEHLKKILNDIDCENSVNKELIKSSQSQNKEISREWEEKNLALEKELEEKAHLIKLQKEEIKGLKEKIKKIECTYSPTHTTSKGDKFVNALSGSLSTIPRRKEEHENFNNMNNEFSD